ncbi:MAG: hypothetical protein Q4A83_07375 [Bacillota bacterium]|nr:hypothetical protein [Bacillota bacterium]
MGQLVDQYLQQKRAEAARKEYQEKANVLIQEGLVIKDYNPSNIYSDDYPNCDWDGPNAGRYYRVFPIAVTDDEYEEIKKYHDSKKTFSSSNGIANDLKVISIIVYIATFIAGIVLGSTLGDSIFSDNDFAFGSAFIVWIYGLISGSILLGLSEAVSLLQSLKDKPNQE